MAGEIPLHPSFEDRVGAPDRLFASLDNRDAERQVTAWQRLFAKGGAAGPAIAHLHRLTPQHDALARVTPTMPVVAHLHGTELKMLDGIRRRRELAVRLGSDLTGIAADAAARRALAPRSRSCRPSPRCRCVQRRGDSERRRRRRASTDVMSARKPDKHDGVRGWSTTLAAGTPLVWPARSATEKRHFRGHDELPAGLNAADVLVAPSVDEPFGLVYLEAMACGLPVVTTPTGGRSPSRTPSPDARTAGSWIPMTRRHSPPPSSRWSTTLRRVARVVRRRTSRSALAMPGIRSRRASSRCTKTCSPTRHLATHSTAAEGARRATS
jgi:Glycosyl transferases group 1